MAAGDVNIVAIASLIVFFAALVSSVGGFAFSAIAATPLLRLFDDPLRVVTVMVACSITIQVYSVLTFRRSLQLDKLVPFVAGGMVTVPLGVWMLSLLPAEPFCLGLGACLVGYGIYLLTRRSPRIVHGSRAKDALIGALGGLTGGLVGFPGGPVTVWCGMQGWPSEVQRGVYQPYILAMQLEALIFLQHGSVKRLSAELALYCALALAAAYVGIAIFKRLTPRQFHTAVYSLLVISGASLLTSAGARLF